MLEMPRGADMIVSLGEGIPLQSSLCGVRMAQKCEM